MHMHAYVCAHVCAWQLAEEQCMGIGVSMFCMYGGAIVLKVVYVWRCCCIVFVW